MSVYTSISRDELETYLTEYSVGKLVRFIGIESGIENTNYFVTTSTGEFVLTIFEQHTREELPFFLDLTAYLADHKIPCAHPIANNRKKYLGMLKNKPTALVNRLDGAALGLPTPTQCSAVGDVLARLHQSGLSFPQSRTNTRGQGWQQDTADVLGDRLSSDDQALLREEMKFQSDLNTTGLPQGIIHADLFRDNALFKDDRVCGVIDFYYACTDILLYDVAITVNDWCSNGDGTLDNERAQYLLAGYNMIRPTHDDERAAWAAMLRAAALRFWLSRLYDMHFPRPGEMTHIKDPEVFRRILANRSQEPESAFDLWPKQNAPHTTTG